MTDRPEDGRGGGTESLPPSTRAIYAIFDYVATHRPRIAWAAAAVVAAAIVLNGFYVVKKEEEALRTRFGRVVEENIAPGLHYRIPAIERAWIRPVHRIAEHSVSSRRDGQEMFTILSGDQNLLEVTVAIQYRIDHLRNYLFVTPDPIGHLTKLTRQELVSIIGQNFIDLILSLNRNIIQDHLFDEITESLELHDVGVELVALNIVDVRPIDETRAAFRDVTDAISERNEAISNANLRSERMLSRSRGQAEAVVREAQARAHERLAQAGGSASAFLMLLDEYNRDREQVAITRYWQRMRTIFNEASLAAVNPAAESVIDVNMIEGVAAVPPLSMPAPAPFAAGGAPSRPLTAFTAPETAHAMESADVDRFLSLGAWHERTAERDDLMAGRPRSLIFDTPAIFAHGETLPAGAVAAQQQVLQPMLDTIADDMDAETPASEPVAVPATAVPDSGLPSLAQPTPSAAPEAPAAPETTEATEAPANQ